jgi:hypothetical protein
MKDLVRAKLEDGTVVSVGESFAKSKGLELVDEPAVSHGRTVPAITPVTLRGNDLNVALEAAGLSIEGKLAEKQERLAAFNATQNSGDQQVAGTPTE